jgi:hypothetical protein
MEAMDAMLQPALPPVKHRTSSIHSERDRLAAGSPRYASQRIIRLGRPADEHGRARSATSRTRPWWWRRCASPAYGRF